MASLSLRIRAAVLVALCSLLLFTFCIDVHGDDSSLKSLYDGHRWFELRDFIEKEGASAFYQGAVACAFNDLRRCDKKLRAVFNSAPRSDEAVEAHRSLASAYFTHGKYKKALAQVDAILAESPDQELAGRHTTVELRDGGLPFSVHGVQATYWFDTGAELSVLSQKPDASD